MDSWHKLHWSEGQQLLYTVLHSSSDLLQWLGYGNITVNQAWIQELVFQDQDEDAELQHQYQVSISNAIDYNKFDSG